MWSPEMAARGEDAAARWIFGAAYVRVHHFVSAEAAAAFAEEVATLAEAHVRRFEDAQMGRGNARSAVPRPRLMNPAGLRVVEGGAR
jgi:hypothetical protein